ncbi:hypothetical protein FB451DRAFT_1208082 [Mycena latifolia]|nr:hypothetical protein FB451DRAFT_1208082 [Mycena latifolia]
MVLPTTVAVAVPVIAVPVIPTPVQRAYNIALAFGRTDATLDTFSTLHANRRAARTTWARRRVRRCVRPKNGHLPCGNYRPRRLFALPLPGQGRRKRGRRRCKVRRRWTE